MSEPLDTNSITHWLEFINGGEGEFQIDEPISFDAAEFVIQQEDGRYGRDLSFSGEEIDLEFPNTAGSRYGYQFDKLLEYDDVYGYESEVLYKIKDSGTEFVVGQLDFYTKETDRWTKMSCKVIQETKQQLLKRRAKTDVDLFGTEDLDGNEISPLETSNILLVAKPITNTSSWTGQYPFWFYTGFSNTSGILRTYWSNNYVNINTAAIEDTLSGGPNRSLLTWYNDSDFYDKVYDMGKINAQTNLTNFSWTLEGITISIYFNVSESFSDNWLAEQTPTFYEYILPQGQENYNQDDIYPSGQQQSDVTTLSGEWVDMGEEYRDDFAMSGMYKRWDYICDDTTYESENSVPNGYRWTGLFAVRRAKTYIVFEGGDFSVKATGTFISSTTKAARLIDAISQVNTAVNTELELDAPRFDSNGEWYDNFVFDGNMIRGRDTKFTMKWEDVENLMMEFNSDYEVDSDTLFCGKYDDFYTNQEIGAFLISPDSTFNMGYNERYAINKFAFGYKNYNQDKDDDNTIDGMHTVANFSVKNKQVENEKEIEVDTIRDAYLIETTRKKAFESGNSGTSSLSQDNKLFIVDVVELEDGEGADFQDTMYHTLDSSDETNLQLINDGSYNWTLLGFAVGDDFTIENTDNADTYTVADIETGTLTLTPQNITPETIGSQLTEVSYVYTTVDYKTRTSEGFDSITGVEEPNSYINLLYTPKRNILNNWSSYLASCVLYNESDISIQSFVNEPTLVTQYNGGDEIEENANISQSDLDEPLLSARTITTKVLCDFSTYQQYADLLQLYRGFVRVYDTDGRIRRGFVSDSRFSWKDNTLELVLEEFYESETLFISFDYDSDSYIINRAGYPRAVLPDMGYQTEGDYIWLIDQLNRPLSAKYRYDKVSVQGEFYDNIVDVSTAISIL